MQIHVGNIARYWSRKEGLFKVNTENVAQNEEDSKRDI